MITVSVTDFRNNLSEYLRKVKYMGEKVVVMDEKIGEPMVEVSGAKKTRTDAEWDRKALRRADIKSLRKRLEE